jgi:hypothetical protein
LLIILTEELRYCLSLLAAPGDGNIAVHPNFLLITEEQHPWPGFTPAGIGAHLGPAFIVQIPAVTHVGIAAGGAVNINHATFSIV